jgi:hypothetical protein
MYARSRCAGLRTPLLGHLPHHAAAQRREWLQMLCYRPFFWSAEQLVFVCERSAGTGARAASRRAQRGDLQRRRPRALAAGARRGARRRCAACSPAARRLRVGMSAVLRPRKTTCSSSRRSPACAPRHRRACAADRRREMRGASKRARERSASRRRWYHRPAAGRAPSSAHATRWRYAARPVETFSLAALEAMALAGPVVHADVGGARK